MADKKMVHFKVKSEKGFTALLCRPERLPNQEALVTTTIEKCTCLTCLKLLHMSTEMGMTYVNGSFDSFIEN
jgi:hypothetical protein